jgi:hypothetical protein
MQSENPLTADRGPAAAVKDLLPIPATDPTDLDFGGQGSSTAPGAGTTFSHALASEAREGQGPGQSNHEKDVLDLGWNERKQDITAPLVAGMDNDELWLLVRRFNKVGRTRRAKDHVN